MDLDSHGIINISGTGNNQIYTDGGDFLINPGHGTSYVHCGSGVETITFNPDLKGKALTTDNFSSVDKLFVSESFFESVFKITDNPAGSWGRSDQSGLLNADYFKAGTGSVTNTSGHAQFLFNTLTGNLAFSAVSGAGTVLGHISLQSGVSFSADNILVA